MFTLQIANVVGYFYCYTFKLLRDTITRFEFLFITPQLFILIGMRNGVERGGAVRPQAESR